MQMLSLPPSVTLSPTVVGVTVLTQDGATVQVDLPRPKGLHDMPDDEIARRARELAKAALLSAAGSL